MKILHIASFKGNVGDNASHMGFYSILDSLGLNYHVDKLEIRKLYKNYKGLDKILLDAEFIRVINSYDLCVFGGGGFLDYWVPDSQTGTTIDLAPSLIASITTPTLFTSIGSNPHKEIPTGNIDKFKIFLQAIAKNKKIKIALRNDGSVESIKKDLGPSYINGIVEILDHGFFYEKKLTYSALTNSKYVAINITFDQLLMKSKLRKSIDIIDYLNELRKIIDFCITSEGLDVILVPHIYSDLKAIYQLLDVLDNSYVRNNLIVAPCVQGDLGANIIFSIYENSEYVIGTRFHTNVCSLAMGKRSIGLVALDRIEYLYRSLELEDNAVLIENGFSEKVIDLIENGNSSRSDIINLNKRSTLKFYENYFRSLSFL